MAQREQGFTLIELMVVLLVLAILLAVAVPTFLGARESAWDRAAQSNVRNAHTTLMVFYADERAFTESDSALQDIDPSLGYINTSPTQLEAGAEVFVEVQSPDPARPNNTVLIAGRSGSGRCYWLRTIGDENHPRFSHNDCGAVPPAGTFGDRWES